VLTMTGALLGNEAGGGRRTKTASPIICIWLLTAANAIGVTITSWRWPPSARRIDDPSTPRWCRRRFEPAPISPAAASDPRGAPSGLGNLFQCVAA
jgi:hypothetical protein